MRALVPSAAAIGRKETLAIPCSSRYSSAALLQWTFRLAMIRSLHVTVVSVKSPREGRKGGPMSTERIPLEVGAVRLTRAPGAPGRGIGAIAAIVLLQRPWPRWRFPGESLSGHVLRELAFWLMTGLLLAYVLFGERRSLRSIGLVMPGWKSLAWGVGGAVLMVAASVVLYLVILPALGMS